MELWPCLPQSLPAGTEGGQTLDQDPNHPHKDSTIERGLLPWIPIDAKSLVVDFRVRLKGRLWLLLSSAAHGKSGGDALSFWAPQTAYLQRLGAIEPSDNIALEGEDVVATTAGVTLPATLHSRMSALATSAAESQWLGRVSVLQEAHAGLQRRVEQQQAELALQREEYEQYRERIKAVVRSRTSELHAASARVAALEDVQAANDSLNSQLAKLNIEAARLALAAGEGMKLRGELALAVARLEVRERDLLRLNNEKSELLSRIESMGQLIFEAEQAQKLAEAESTELRFQVREMESRLARPDLRANKQPDVATVSDKPPPSKAALASLPVPFSGFGSLVVHAEMEPRMTIQSPVTSLLVVPLGLTGVLGNDDFEGRTGSAASEVKQVATLAHESEIKQVAALAHEDAKALESAQLHIRRLQELLSKCECENLLSKQRANDLDVKLEALRLQIAREAELFGKGNVNYLKNIILRYMESNDHAALFPVISTVLCLSPEEIAQVNEKRAALSRGYFGLW
jgi:hypothetical protein